jgi:ParB-like chromosome segregation protein Spo0J
VTSHDPIINSRYEVVALELVQPHPRNPRRGDVRAIADLIDANGFYGAIVVQKSTGYILAGNHRWLAAKDRGHQTIPAIYVDVDDEHALRILTGDNRASDLGRYDDLLLTELLSELPSLGGTGYDQAAVDALLAGAALSAFEAGEED